MSESYSNPGKLREKPEWKRFEELVAEIQRELAPGATVTTNVKKKGRRSGVYRQIDILVEIKVAQFQMAIAIDCKNYKHPIDVKDVEAFISMIDDLDVTKGAMVASIGFTAGATARAKDAGVDTYQLLDARNPPLGKLLAIPVAIRDLHFASYRVSLTFTPLQDAIPPQDLRYMKVYRADGSFVDCLQNLIIDRLTSSAIPFEPGEHKRQPLADSATWIRGVHLLCQVELLIDYSIVQEFRIGRLPVQDMKGFLDCQREQVTTKGFTTSVIDTHTIGRNWDKVDSLDSLPVKPILLLTRHIMPQRIKCSSS